VAFVKLYKIVQDSPVSYQYANQLSDNQQALKDLMAVEHGTVEYQPGAKGVAGAPALDYHRLGRHDLAEIPRTVGAATLSLLNLTTIGIAPTWMGAGISTVFKVDIGVYLIPIVGLTSWWAVVTPAAGSTVTYLHQVRPFYASTANGNNAGLRVYFYRLDSTDFVPVDASFSIALYGKTT
jgi:hypothetical protein